MENPIHSAAWRWFTNLFVSNAECSAGLWAIPSDYTGCGTKSPPAVAVENISCVRTKDNGDFE